MMPRGSEDADPGAQNRYQFFMMPRGSEDADPGAQNRYHVVIPVPYFCFNTGTVILHFQADPRPRLKNFYERIHKLKSESKV
jgi:hypothetical protein